MPIDFVIPWVDGNDKMWLEEKSKYQTTSILEDDTKIRYRDWDNLQYWFRSVEKYAPWVHKIYFVTWGHIPEWLDITNPKLCIMKHTDFIPREYLPTYNSHTIELNLHRIPGLSEQFVYFNDDVFLNSPVVPEDFFKDGLPGDILGLDFMAFGRNTAGIFHANDVGIINDHFDSKKSFRQNPSKWINYRYGIKVIMRTLFMLRNNWFPGFLNQHITNNYLKSTFVEVWEKEFEILDCTCKCKFRAPTNVNQWLMREWQLAKANFVPRRKKFGRCFSTEGEMEDLLKTIEKGKYPVICMNDTAGTDSFEEKKELIKQAFERKLPNKSSFEK